MERRREEVRIDVEESPVPLTELERQGSQLLDAAKEPPSLQYTNIPAYSRGSPGTSGDLEPPGEAECPGTPAPPVVAEPIEEGAEEVSRFCRCPGFLRC